MAIHPAEGSSLSRTKISPVWLSTLKSGFDGIWNEEPSGIFEGSPITL